LFIFDSIRVLRCAHLPLCTCKPLEHVVRCILNAITGLVKLANNFERLVAQLELNCCANSRHFRRSPIPQYLAKDGESIQLVA
jgi:hypothetical protein